MEPFYQWVIYHKPKDHPDAEYVVRKWEIVSNNFEPQLTDEVIKAATLDEARLALPIQRLICFQRDPSDDPVIVETWM